jgi:hypothetical protein
MTPIFRAVRTALPALLILAGYAAAQPPIDLPRLSPRATVSQEFGYAKITVIYSRPAVAGRPVWGGVVPYGRVWRAGANEPTVIEFTRDVSINGNPLAAGSYGLFILPEKQGKQDSWTFIFSRNTKGWGAYGYDAKDDALRVTVKAQKVEKSAHQERMEFAFDDISDAGATLSLHWESLRGALALTSEFLETGKANIAKGMPNIKPEDPYSWLGAARFYWVYNIDRKQAMEWVDKSIAVKPLFNNLWAKAEWLAEDKRYAEALESGMKAREEAAKDPGTASQIPAMDKVMKGWTKK